MHLCQTINLKHWQEWKTYSLIRCSSNKGKELSQQHTVCWLVSAVLYGQRLQQGKWAAAMTSRVVSPSEDKKVCKYSQTLFIPISYLHSFYLIQTEEYLCGACVNSKSWLAIISKSEGADMLRKKTGCFTVGITVLASDTDWEAEKKQKKNWVKINFNSYWHLIKQKHRYL